MPNFPAFMMSSANAVPSQSQSEGVKGWIYNGEDDKQADYWICKQDGTSAQHTHSYDEYFFVIDGEYELIIQGKNITLLKGDEYHIPTGVPHSGKFKAGTRTFHCFGGKRA